MFLKFKAGRQSSNWLFCFTRKRSYPNWSLFLDCLLFKLTLCINFRTCRINPQWESMPINKDQISGIDPKCGPIKIIADQSRSVLLNKDQCRSILIGIDLYWQELFFIDRHWFTLGINPTCPEIGNNTWYHDYNL